MTAKVVMIGRILRRVEWLSDCSVGHATIVATLVLMVTGRVAHRMIRRASGIGEVTVVALTAQGARVGLIDLQRCSRAIVCNWPACSLTTYCSRAMSFWRVSCGGNGVRL